MARDNKKIVRPNQQSNLRGSCQSNFSLCWHLPRNEKAITLSAVRCDPNLLRPRCNGSWTRAFNSSWTTPVGLGSPPKRDFFFAAPSESQRTSRAQVHLRGDGLLPAVVERSVQFLPRASPHALPAGTTGIQSRWALPVPPLPPPAHHRLCGWQAAWQ